MNCPKCGQEHQGHEEECRGCGLIFAKWEAAPHRLPSPRPAGELESPTGPTFPRWVVVLVVCAVAFGVWRYLRNGAGEDAPPAGSGSEGVVATAPAPAGELPLERLDGILREMNAEASAYGVEFSLSELSNTFEGGHFVNLHPDSLGELVDAAGLTPLTSVELTAEDRENISRDNFLVNEAKCLVEGGWQYSADLPDHDRGISECWKCRGGSFPGGYSNCRHLVLYTWQPHFGKWSAFSEEDELRGLEHKIHRVLYTYEEEARAREESERMLERAEDDPQRIKDAILKAYSQRILREGALHQLEKLSALWD